MESNERIVQLLHRRFEVFNRRRAIIRAIPLPPARDATPMLSMVFSNVPPLPVGPIILGAFNVGALPALVAAAKQNDQVHAAPCAIQAVSRPHVHAQFKHTDITLDDL